MAHDDERLDVDRLTFVWSRTKASTNHRKHGVTFEEAATVFMDPLARIRAFSPRGGSTRGSGDGSSANSWRANPYATRISASGRRHLAMRALAAELGAEFAILAPDLAKVFPDSDAVNAALRALLEASKTVRKATSKKRKRAA